VRERRTIHIENINHKHTAIIHKNFRLDIRIV